MAHSNTRERLVDFLDRKAFQPVLHASPEEYRSEADKTKLREVQEKTHTERQRYRERYTTAEEVRDNFRADLTSEHAKKVHRQLRELNLPTLPDIKDEFERLCQELGVGRGR